MTDLEMTRLAAEAMGLRVFVDAYGALCLEQLDILSADNVVYDPLHDDAQAMALVKRFRIDIYAYDSSWAALLDDNHLHHRAPIQYIALELNRAIVECCARMQHQKKAQAK